LHLGADRASARRRRWVTSPREEAHVATGSVQPWEPSDELGRERATLIRAVLAQRDSLEPHLWTPFPQNATCYRFGERGVPLPIGALFALWDRWPPSRGECPRCGGRGYAYAFGGFLNIGGLSGVCLDCERRVQRPRAGIKGLMDEAGAVLADTPYFISGAVLGGTVEGPRRPLVELLRSLDVADLPKADWVNGRDRPAISWTIDGIGSCKIDGGLAFVGNDEAGER